MWRHCPSARPRNLPRTAFRLEQFSELRDARNSAPHHSILRPAQCFALAPLAKKTLRLFVKCSRARNRSKSKVVRSRWAPQDCQALRKPAAAKKRICSGQSSRVTPSSRENPGGRSASSAR
ncbi:hypothetical protein DVJ83_08955 [Deinococcus wulumuqiensis]|uniref:Uncharacterized protein n=1 Tax=Deinococcus wulumuqiensis TaxID=980427 RepID=A0A345IHT2_9DEIO|nr:hypothetical protein DVJ83_08955 [Deinococcus wulumuqiensis]